MGQATKVYYEAVEAAHERFSAVVDSANASMQPTEENGGIRDGRLDLDIVYQLGRAADATVTAAKTRLNADLAVAKKTLDATVDESDIIVPPDEAFVDTPNEAPPRSNHLRMWAGR